MNKDEIKYAMAIIRPAIWALYGRHKLALSGYSKVETRYHGDFSTNEGILDISGWFRVSIGPDFVEVKIENDIVTSLEVGELNV